MQCSAVPCGAVRCGGCCDASSVMGGEGRKGIWSALLWLGCAKVYERKPHGPVRACRFFGLRRAVQNYPRYIQLGTRENQNSPSESFSTCINSGTQVSVGRADRVLQAACPCRWTSPLLPSSPFVSITSIAIVKSLQKQVISSTGRQLPRLRNSVCNRSCIGTGP